MSTENGAANAKYRTEIESFSDIQANGTDGGNPDTWTVRTKAGLTLTYGGASTQCTPVSINQVLHEPTNKRHLWHLNRVQDSTGNWMEYCHAYDSATGEAYPTEIRYTGNAAGVSPFASVKFQYRTRTGVQPNTYYRGQTVKLTRVLESIQTVFDGTVIRQYNLSYRRVGIAQRETLSEIKECANKGTVTECLNPTKFEWKNFDEGTADSVETGFPTQGSGFEQSVGDWDADGINDILATKLDGGVVKAAMFRGRTSGVPEMRAAMQLDSGLVGDYDKLTGDFNGDGRTDVAVVTNGYVCDTELNLITRWINVYSYYSDSTRSTGFGARKSENEVDNDPYSGNDAGCPNAVHSGRLLVRETEKFTVELNGDGRDDIVLVHKSDVGVFTQALLSDGTGKFSVGGFQTLSTSSGSDYLIQPVDLNGDGLTDLAFTKKNGSSIEVRAHLRSVSGYGTATTSTLTVTTGGGNVEHLLLDINGDGSSDLIRTSRTNGTHYFAVFLGRGDGAFATPVYSQAELGNRLFLPTKNRYPRAMDINSDGLADLVFRSATSDNNYIWVMHSRPDGTLQPGPNFVVYGKDSDFHLADMTGDGKGDLVLLRLNDGTSLRLLEAKEGLPSSASAIENGLGARIEIEYKPLTDAAVYRRNADGGRACGGYPSRVLCAASQVVSLVSSSNGDHPMRQVAYAYDTAILNLRGRGFQGFAEVSTTDLTTGIKNQTSYLKGIYSADFESRFWEVGVTHGSLTTLASTGEPVSQIDNSYEGRTVLGSSPPSKAIVQTAKTEKSHEIAPFASTGPYRTRVTQTGYTEPPGPASFFGNPTVVLVRTYAGDTSGPYFETYSGHQYDNDTVSWHLGRLKRTDVTRKNPDGLTASRASGFEYHPTTGLLAAEIIEPDTEFELRTAYGRDDFGNITTTTISGPGGSTRADEQPRTSTNEFAIAAPNFARFKSKSCNALNQCATASYDGTYGNPLSAKDANGRITGAKYDPWGRQDSSSFNQFGISQSRTFTRTYCAPQGTALCQGGALYQLETEDSGGGYTLVLFDELEREMVAFTRAGGGGLLKSITDYNPEGRVLRRSAPRFATGSTAAMAWAYQAYDPLGRVREARDFAGYLTRTEYRGLTTVVYDPLNQTTMREVNALGQPVEVTDHLGGTVTYGYDPYENLTSTVDAGGALTTMGYDVRGRKKRITDPNMGLWRFTYNAFDELIWQRDAKQQIVEMEYDPLGRMTKRTEPEGVTTWTYDYQVGTSTRNWIGGLTQVEQRAPGNPGALLYKRSHTYQRYGSVKTDAITFGGHSDTFSYTDDTQGRPLKIKYPSGLEIQNHYNAYGFVDKVHRAGDPATAYAYWEAQSWDEWNQTFESRYGNGLVNSYYRDSERGLLESITAGPNGIGTTQSLNYTWDKDGNLKTREDAIEQLTERFDYDSLNRLYDVTLITPATPGGVITMRTRFDANGNLSSKSGVGTYTYDPSKPQQLTATSVQSKTYAHDLNGNMGAGAGRTYTWASYNLPVRMVQSGKTVDFTYGPERQRLTQSVLASGKAITYVSALYERHGSTAKQYIPTPDGIVAVESKTGTAAAIVQYWHKDHLGSVDVVTNQAGQVVERLAFDAFGKRVPRLRTGSLAAGTSFSTFYGFTGHEYLDDVGLIHTNGRVYDAQIGRFISADPFIQFPLDGQSHNRYSYVLNNPLTYIDPSGFGVLGDIADSIGDLGHDLISTLGDAGRNAGPQILGLVAASLAGACPECGIDPQTAYTIGFSAGNFLFDDSVSGGDMPDRGPPSTMEGHPPSALVLGSVTHGGGRSRLSDLITEPETRAVVGGTFSEIGAGKFANGAVTVGFANAQGDSNGGYEENNGRAEPVFPIETVVLLPFRLIRAGIQGVQSLLAARAVTNSVPKELARVIAGRGNFPTLGPPTQIDVYVTAAEDIAGMNAKQLAQRLTINEADTFTVVRFPTPQSALASPVNRLNPGFIGGGRTAGGAREFVLPNGPIPAGARIEVIGP